MSEPIVLRLRENGPVLAPGSIKVVDHLGNEFPIAPGKDVVALCRCGHSAKKPFCDGAHKTSGFQGGDPAPKPGS